MASIRQAALPRTNVSPTRRSKTNSSSSSPSHEFLVQLAEPRAAVAEVHGELPRVGDRAAADERELRRAGQRVQPVVDRVPCHAGVEVAQARTGEPARDQPQDALERLGSQVAIRLGAADEVEERGHVPRLDRHAGDDLLRQDVQTSARDAQVLDLSLDHRASERGRFEQVGGRLGDQATPAGPSDDVTRPPDALQPARDLAG